MKTLVSLLLLASLCHPQDPDRDGLPTPVERALGTDPLLADTDGDGIPDGTETVAPLGDPRNRAVTLAGDGVRGFVWRDGDVAIFRVVCRATTTGAAAVWALLPGLGRVDLLPLLHLEAVGQDGTVCLAVSWPTSLLPAGGQLPFAVRLGALRWSGTLLDGAAGWTVLEAVSPSRSRRVAAEDRTVPPFPTTEHYGIRTCAQTLIREGPAADRGYAIYTISDETCNATGPLCVLDCGVMIGWRVLWLEKSEQR